MPSSPFVVGQWVRGEKFYGRAALIEEILDGPRNWLWLLGTRRIGKTSLLKQLEFLTSTPGNGHYFPVFWDFQGAEDVEELNQGFQEALLDAEERLEHLQIDAAEFKNADLFDSLTRLRRRLRSRNLKLLLLCDEVEELIKLHQKDPSLLRKLRRIMQSQEDVRSVLASTIRLWALADQRGDTSPFLHGFAPPLYIHRLTDDEALDLALQAHLPAGSRPLVERATAEVIRSRCDNHPYLMQLVCKRHQELQSVDDATEQVAADPMVSYFFSVDFEMLSEVERDVIRIIAETSTATSNSIQGRIAQKPEELGGILHRLENLGYVRRNAERRFELVNHFFRKWFLKQPRSPLEAAEPPEDQSTRAEGVATDLVDGRYHVLQEMGRGATGVVYKAQDEVLREAIALKILKPEYSQSSEVLERFRQEILLARDIPHPNIAKVYHMGEWRGQRYLTMKWIGGPTLARLIARESPMAIDRALGIARKLASALEAAHARKVIHRDIKPQNILMDEGDEPYLTDFGLARLLGAPGMTQSGEFIGTPYYASPEQAKLLPIDERSDVYSLGVVLFEMFVGKRPFQGGSISEVLEKHRRAPPPDPIQSRPQLPRAVSRVILRCLEKAPERRYASGRELKVALEAV